MSDVGFSVGKPKQKDEDEAHPRIELRRIRTNGRQSGCKRDTAENGVEHFGIAQGIRNRPIEGVFDGWRGLGHWYLAQYESSVARCLLRSLNGGLCLARFAYSLLAVFVSNSSTDFDPATDSPLPFEKPVSCGEKMQDAACARTIFSVPAPPDASTSDR